MFSTRRCGSPSEAGTYRASSSSWSSGRRERPCAMTERTDENTGSRLVTRGTRAMEGHERARRARERRVRISRTRGSRSSRPIASKRVAARDSARARRGILAKRRWRFFLGVQVFGARATCRGARLDLGTRARVTHLVCMAVDIMAAIVARLPVRRESGRANVRIRERLRAFRALFAAAVERTGELNRHPRVAKNHCPILSTRVTTGENLRK